MTDTSSGTSLQRLSDLEEIRDVLIRYASGIDRKDWPLFRSCWTDEIRADYGGIGAWSTADEITDWMDQAHRKYRATLHRITNIAIELQADTATARNYVDVVLYLDAEPKMLTGKGYYDDRLVRTESGWRIAERDYTMVHFQTDLPA